MRSKGNWRFSVTGTDDTGASDDGRADVRAQRDARLAGGDPDRGATAFGASDVVTASFDLAHAANVTVTVEKRSGIVIAHAPVEATRSGPAEGALERAAVHRLTRDHRRVPGAGRRHELDRQGDVNGSLHRAALLDSRRAREHLLELHIAGRVSRRVCRLRADGDRRGLPRGERARHALRRRGRGRRLRSAHQRVALRREVRLRAGAFS